MRAREEGRPQLLVDVMRRVQIIVSRSATDKYIHVMRTIMLLAEGTKFSKVVDRFTVAAVLLIL